MLNEWIYKTEEKGNALVISLQGSLLTESQTKEILSMASDKLQAGNVHFIFNLKDLRFINSSGLGMLLTILTKARKAGGEVILAHVPEQVLNLLTITKLHTVFEMTDHVAAAVEALQNR